MFKADFFPQKPTENLYSGFQADIGSHTSQICQLIPTENVFFILLVLELAESQILIIFGAFVGEGAYESPWRRHILFAVM
jgi:hypothetical protein